VESPAVEATRIGKASLGRKGVEAEEDSGKLRQDEGGGVAIVARRLGSC